METEPAEQLRRVAWNASPEDSLMAVAGYVLASDETVARWRERLGIVAEPTPVSLDVDSLLHILKRLDNLENAEAARRAAKDADTSPKVRWAPNSTPVCHDCWTRPAVPSVVGADGRSVYCRDCWAKRDAGRMKDEPLRQSADEWLATPEFSAIVIADPDGWNRAAEDWDKEWATPLTWAEFKVRLARSTTARYVVQGAE